MPALFDVNLIYGVMQIGCFINLWLSSLEIGQAALYLSQRTKDSHLVRYGVMALVFFNLLTTSAECAIVYTYTITHWGDLSFLTAQPYSLAVYIIGTGSSTLIAQSFLAFRATRLMVNKALQWSTRAFLMIGPLAAFAAAVWTMAESIRFPAITPAARDQLLVPGKMTLITNACSDVLIALVFVVELLRVKRIHPTMADGETNRSARLIRSLIINAIKTGSVTSCVALIGLILFLGIPNTNAPLATTFFLGRLYGLSMLVNLNARQNQSEMKASSSNGTSTGFSIRKKNPTGSPYLEGISVETDTAVSRDQSHKEAPIQLSKINNYAYGDDKDAFARGPGAV